MNDGVGCELARLSATRAVLRTADGIRIEARYEPYAGPADRYAGGRTGGAVVLAHGFTGSLDRPALRRAAAAFRQRTAVVTFSFRGHGRSGGRSTVGDREVLDLAAAVAWARALGHSRIATVGFSMGGSVVLRHAALHKRTAGRTGARAATADADAAVAVSAPARWYYNGTAPMRRLHWAVQRPLGRLVARHALRTRIHPEDWDPVPLPPVAAAPLITPTPLLLVHGDRDPYFPLDHPCSLAEAADPRTTDLWLVPGFGHAENAADPALLDRIGGWAADRLAPLLAPRIGATPATGAPTSGARRHHGTRNAADG